MPGPATNNTSCDSDDDDDDQNHRDFELNYKISHYNSEQKTSKWANNFNIKVGDLLDIKDSVGIWAEAEILKVDMEGKRIFVTYLYWTQNYNEWVSDIDSRVARLNTHTYYHGGPFKIGQRIEALDKTNKWLEAFVIEVDDYRIKVHYKGWSSKFDEWHDSQDPKKLRRYGMSKSTNTRPPKEKSLFKIPGVELLNMNDTNLDMKNYENDRSDNNRYLKDDSDSKADSKSSINYKNASVQNNHTRQISENSDRYTQYMTALKYQNLRVVACSGDGNCLFRSVAHQIYGDEEFHDIVRQKCMDYMEAEADFFSQFVEGGMQYFHLYLKAKRTPSCWGDDPEIQAICELYRRSTEIWAYDTQKGAQKLKTFHETSIKGNARPVIRLSYYGGGHYDSIVKEKEHSLNVLQSVPGEIEDERIREVIESRRIIARESRSINLDDVKHLSDIEETERTQINMALQISNYDRLGWADENIETCLLNYLQNSYNEKESLDIIDIEKTSLRITDVAATQGEVLRLVTEQSELEFLDKAILSSLTNDSKSVMKDDNNAQIGLINSNQQNNDNEDYINITKYENMSEDEALALALQQSVNSSNVNFDSSVEDQLLKAVMQESMKSAEKYNDDEYINIDDEEMMINEAIRASYQYK